MSAAQSKPAEPSMEEILASIRRIISDDQTSKVAPASPVAPSQPAPVASFSAPAVEDDEEVLDLAPKPLTKAEQRAIEPHFLADDPISNDLSFEDPVAQAPKGQDDIDALMAAAEFDSSPVPVPLPVAIERLVSPTTDRMVSTAFSSLATTILSKNARTLEDLIQDMMRPMIKTWLDDNLPIIVERLVKTEIERVSRGGR
jgi:uncharacterized protein